ncbi:hypothetical protein J6590_000657 [Homalodisca vitripennis]|nr:hypothetical protein J6590_000657 [Homalodisca vitripennis]
METSHTGVCCTSRSYRGVQAPCEGNPEELSQQRSFLSSKKSTNQTSEKGVYKSSLNAPTKCYIQVPPQEGKFYRINLKSSAFKGILHSKRAVFGCIPMDRPSCFSGGFTVNIFLRRADRTTGFLVVVPTKDFEAPYSERTACLGHHILTDLRSYASHNFPKLISNRHKSSNYSDVTLCSVRHGYFITYTNRESWNNVGLHHDLTNPGSGLSNSNRLTATPRLPVKSATDNTITFEP